MQSLQYKNLCKAVSKEGRKDQTTAVGKEHYNIRNEITQGAQLSGKL